MHHICVAHFDNYILWNRDLHDFVALSLCQDGCQEKEQNLYAKEGYYEPSIHWFIMKKSYIKNINENTTLIQYPISHLAYVIF